MPRVILLPEAVKDTKRLIYFLQNKNLHAAKNLAQLFKEAKELLSNFPKAGQPINYNSDIRELLIPFGQNGYILRYRIKAENVAVMRVWHSRETRDYSEQ